MSIKNCCLLCVALVSTCLFTPHQALAIEDVSVSVETQVREYFKTTPVMIEIARCESKFRQFGSDGKVLRGGWSGNMVGTFQFFESVHSSFATKLGFDLTTLKGNLGYAEYLYTQSGTTPWNSSKACWSSVAVSTSTPSKLTKADVAKLQKKVETLKKTLAELERMLKKKKEMARK